MLITAFIATTASLTGKVINNFVKGMLYIKDNPNVLTAKEFNIKQITKEQPALIKSFPGKTVKITPGTYPQRAVPTFIIGL